MIRALLPLLLAGAALAGCARTAPASDGPPRLRSRPLVDSRHLPCDFGWQQEITASRGPFRHSFSVVVECAHGKLTIVGLTPYGTRAFTLLQDGTSFRASVEGPEALPFPPENILFDLHRALFWGFSSDPSENRPRAGDGERRVDRFVEGRLVERRILARGTSEERLRITYGEGYVPGTPPPEVLLTSETFGAEIRVVTVAATRLPPSPSKDGATLPSP